jgi:hypothetical protein
MVHIILLDALHKKVLYQYFFFFFSNTLGLLSVLYFSYLKPLWRSVLLVEETGLPSENNQPVASHKQTLLHTTAHNRQQRGHRKPSYSKSSPGYELCEIYLSGIKHHKPKLMGHFN